MAAVPGTNDPVELLERARSGDRGALARLLSVVESGGEAARAVGHVAHPSGGHAYTLGLTGAPGSGKSTLTSALVTQEPQDRLVLGVLATHPSPPLPWGALPGARVRRCCPPPVSAGILDGTTRGIVMKIVTDLGHPLAEPMMTRHDLYTADEVFLTGTAAEIISVVKYDKRTIGDGKPGPFTLQCIEKYRELTRTTGTPIYND